MRRPYRIHVLTCSAHRGQADENQRHSNRTGQGFAAARVNALKGGLELGETIAPLYAIHKALKATHASGELTDQQYTEKARELLWMVGRLRNALFHKTMA